MWIHAHGYSCYHNHQPYISSSLEMTRYNLRGAGHTCTHTHTLADVWAAVTNRGLGMVRGLQRYAYKMILFCARVYSASASWRMAEESQLINNQISNH